MNMMAPIWQGIASQPGHWRYLDGEEFIMGEWNEYLVTQMLDACVHNAKNARTI